MEKIIKKIKEKYDLPYGLLFLLPRGYEASFGISKISDALLFQDKTRVSVVGTISNIRIKPMTKISNIYANITDETGMMMINWISSNSKAEYKADAIRDEYLGKMCQVTGEISSFSSSGSRFVYLSKPSLSEINLNDISGSKMKAMPIYPLKSGVKKYEIEKMIKFFLSTENIKSSFPFEYEKNNNLPPLKESLEIIHGLKEVDSSLLPDFLSENTIWHKRIQLEMIWETLIQMKNEKVSEVSPVINFDKKSLIELEDKLPFDLTLSQKKALGVIFKTLSSGSFEKILLQGDVGSGKTLVSVFSSKIVLDSEFNQVAIIAPSTVLAKQLYEEYNHLLGKNYNVFLAAGKIKVSEKKKIQKSLDSDKPTVIIGTTAVNSFSFPRLGLLIIDEEQKMGVKAKNKLLLDREVVPYQILMSATPIPRSLAQSIFGNVKIAKIESKPSGRLPVKTKIIKNEESLKKLFSFIKSESEKGRKTLFVAPSIASDEMASIEKVIDLCHGILGENFPIGIIHGEMTEKKIEEEIASFKNSEKQILIATSMVEAGFSVPDMSVVVIVSPDRFGLSQLHQIRGRGGRSAGLQAYCALLPLNDGFKLSDDALHRLEFFSREYDGFVLSNEDMKLRGTGELIGISQSGTGKLDFVSNINDVIALQQFL